MKFTVQTDSENDQCYIAIGETAFSNGAVKRTTVVSEQIALDFDAEGRLIGIDIQNASTLLGQDLLDAPEADALVGVREAAALAGVKAPNFVRDFANRAGFPAPVADLASGRVWTRSSVEDYLKARRARSLAS